MTRLLSFALPALLLSSAVTAVPVLESRQSGISQTVYDNLVRYTKYSSAVYQWICPRPLGNPLVDQVCIKLLLSFLPVWICDPNHTFLFSLPTLARTVSLRVMIREKRLLSFSEGPQSLLTLLWVCNLALLARNYVYQS